jgi:hypothetical protein
LLIRGRTIHADKEMILVFDQENQHVLAQLVLVWRHIVLWVGEQAGLEDGRKIGRVHSVLVGFGRENCQQIKDVEQ